MILDVCPTLDELRHFLDEQLELARQAEIGTHVDRCESCQATLEGLTQAEAANLLGTSLAVLTCLPGRGAEAQGSTNGLERIHNGAEKRPHPNIEANLAHRPEGDSTVDEDGSTTDLSAGETGAHDG